MANLRANNFWFRSVLNSLMAERGITCKQMAEKMDRAPSLIEAVLDGTHMPSVYLAEQMLYCVGYEFEVIVIGQKK